MILATAYLDTNFYSIRHYSGGNATVLARRVRTEDWLKLEGQQFAFFTSNYTVLELSKGVYSGQKLAIAAARRTRHLASTAMVQELTREYLRKKLIPENKEVDAIQLAFSTAYEIDYLISWNFSHLTNLQTQQRLDELNAMRSLRSPLLVSPMTIPWGSLGLTVRRKVE